MLIKCYVLNFLRRYFKFLTYLQEMSPNLNYIGEMIEFAMDLFKKNSKSKMKILEKEDLQKLDMNLILEVNSDSK